jgi:hypothetical protein
LYKLPKRKSEEHAGTIDHSRYNYSHKPPICQHGCISSLVFAVNKEI